MKKASKNILLNSETEHDSSSDSISNDSANSKKVHSRNKAHSNEVQKQKKGTVNKNESSFPIIGIGASAGGLAAIESFFRAMPSEPDFHPSFILVQHLDPDHKSILTELIKNFTKIPVLTAIEGIKVEQDNIYVIPPNHNLALSKGELKLTKRELPHGLNFPVNFLFESLAKELKERSVCVILSGTGTDGTHGLKAIKDEGGLCFVQLPESAQYDGMLISAIATGVVDFILPPEQIGEQIQEYLRNSYKNVDTPELNISQGSEDIIKKIFLVLKNHTGHDFSNYKPTAIRRRIERRMVIHGIEKLGDYYKYLKSNPIELETLFSEFLIGVTNFFRDKNAFDSLYDNVIPKLFADRSPDESIRIWIPGCSTGEDAYSIAILFREFMDKHKKDHNIQIFATDMDTRALVKARTGIFPDGIAANISAIRLSKYFVRENENYKIKKTLRDMVIFAKQDLIKDPPFSNLDLIICRNLLIYFGQQIQRKIIPVFHYALKKNGYLFLGSSESISNFHELFTSIDKKWKIYVKKAFVSARPKIPNFTPPVFSDTINKEKTMTNSKNSKTELRNIIDQKLKDDYAPSCVIINSDFDVIYINGSTGKFLEPAKGEASLNLSRMIRDGMKMELIVAVKKVVANNTTVRYDCLKVKNDSGVITVNLVVQPLKNNDFFKGLLMVIFEEVKNNHKGKIKETHKTVTDKDQRIIELERVIVTKDEYLQTNIEELETSNEELKSVNEEMQSANEELQSTNEELETSKDKLQSANEELVTLNLKLQKKIEELSRVTNDMNNLLAGIGIGTIFVDHELKIQRFTPAITQIINLIPTDVGRPVSHIVSRLINYSTLIEDVKIVLNTLIPKEEEVLTKDNHWYLMRIQPYRTLDNTIEGAVLTFVDITIQKNLMNKTQDINIK